MKTEYEQYIKDAEAEIIRLRAENERLRKALQVIADAPGGGPGRRIAKQALGEKS